MAKIISAKQFVEAMIPLCFCLVILLFASGYQNREYFQTVFPLEADEVMSLLKQVGLPGEISEDETESWQEGHISYVIRDSTETYGDSENNKMIANVVFLSRKNGRALSTVFNQRVMSEILDWSDWEQQIKFATLLYGGFADEEALYKVCKEANLPNETAAFRWETELPEGYCCVYYKPRKNKAYDENSYEVVTYSATMWVDIYESRELYEQVKGY